MKLIKEIYHKNVSSEVITKPETYTLRKASRAIVLNDKNEIAIINVSKRKFYKLPGGGMEENEDIMETLRRELLEETGCEVNVTDEVGVVIEYRDGISKIQISYCYVAQILSMKEKQLTEKELNDGFQLEFMTIDEAIEKMQESIKFIDTSDDYHAKFITRRDLAFLEEYKSK